MIHHHRSSISLVLRHGLREIHHMRPETFPLALDSAPVKILLGSVPEIDIFLRLLTELLQLRLELSLLAAHLSL